MCKNLQSKNPVDHHIITQTAAPDLKHVFIPDIIQWDLYQPTTRMTELLRNRWNHWSCFLLTFLLQMSQMDFYNLLALFSKIVGILIILTVYSCVFLVYFHAVI